MYDMNLHNNKIYMSIFQEVTNIRVQDDKYNHTKHNESIVANLILITEER